MIEDRTADTDLAMSRAKVYGFLSSAFLYPRENWTEDVVYALSAAHLLGYKELDLALAPLDLNQLQSEYLRTIGISGPLLYETEYGLDGSFRQSHELADINGFYSAFGYNVGGTVRERPDHLATELEFMHLLALKEWRAAEVDQVEICLDAQRKFLEDHLGRWIEGFAIRVAFEAKDSLYSELARFTVAFVQEEAARLGARPDPLVPERLKPTPYDTSTGCGDCPIPGGIGHDLDPM
jgi:DMSO reductase family type II enzyme chaperone